MTGAFDQITCFGVLPNKGRLWWLERSDDYLINHVILLERSCPFWKVLGAHC